MVLEQEQRLFGRRIALLVSAISCISIAIGMLMVDTSISCETTTCVNGKYFKTALSIFGDPYNVMSAMKDQLMIVGVLEMVTAFTGMIAVWSSERCQKMFECFKNVEGIILFGYWISFQVLLWGECAGACDPDVSQAVLIYIIWTYLRLPLACCCNICIGLGVAIEIQSTESEMVYTGV